jgi:hypothetical protein
MARKYTNKLLEYIEEGVIDKDFVITACLKYMSEDDVKDMIRINQIWDDEEV